MTYVGGSKRSGCVFCAALAAEDDRESLILHRGDRAFIILNLYPYNSGHSMVVPYEHASTLEDLDTRTRAELLELATVAVEASRGVLRCDGFNLGLNLGEVAGAGVADHLHMHVVPRWTGDANFMPILGDTMVMPELLPATYARLRAEIEAAVGERKNEPVTAAGSIVAVPGAGVVLAGDRFPVTRIQRDEMVSETALRAVRDAAGLDAAVAGWAGIGDSPDGRAAYLIATAGLPAIDTTAARIVPVASLESMLIAESDRVMLDANLAVLARLVGDAG